MSAGSFVLSTMGGDPSASLTKVLLPQMLIFWRVHLFCKLPKLMRLKWLVRRLLRYCCLIKVSKHVVAHFNLNCELSDISQYCTCIPVYLHTCNRATWWSGFTSVHAKGTLALIYTMGTDHYPSRLKPGSHMTETCLRFYCLYLLMHKYYLEH